MRFAGHNFQTLCDALQATASETQRGVTYHLQSGEEVTVPWSSVHAESLRRARYFRNLKLTKGSRIALILPYGEDFVPSFYGAIWAGLVTIPLYPPLAMGKLDAYLATLVSILTKSRAQAAVVDHRLSMVLFGALSKIPTLKTIISAKDLVNLPEANDEPAANVQGSDPCLLQFTSGSTAEPKGVVLTHENLVTNCSIGYEYGFKVDVNHMDREVAVSWLPLYHDMGLIGFVIAPMLYRVQTVLIPTMHFIRSPSRWLEAIHTRRGTITFAPNFAYALVTKRTRPEQRTRWDLSSMRYWGCGAEPINPRIIRGFLEAFAPCGVKPTSFLSAYGMAESTVAVSFIGHDEPFHTDIINRTAYHDDGLATPAPASGIEEGSALEFACCGRAFPEHDIQIHDDAGQRLGERTIGEIWLQGPSVSPGYFEDEAATNRTFGNGWLKTGDLGYLADGAVYVTGRKKDLIIINGRNYTPQSIEWVVEEIPTIRKGAVVAFSRPGEQSEELVVVVESTTPPPDLEDQLKSLVSEQLQLSVSDVVILRPGQVPKTSSGKLQRAATRASYLAGTLTRSGNRTMGAPAEKLILAKHVASSVIGRAQEFVRHIGEQLTSKSGSKEEEGDHS